MGKKNTNLKAKDLTRGEKLYIHRKRLGFTQIQLSVELGVCLSEYRAMEFDEEGVVVPYYSVAPLQPYEACAVFRRRFGLSKSELATAVGVSSYWLGQMESGAVPLRRLMRYWEGKDCAVE